MPAILKASGESVSAGREAEGKRPRPKRPPTRPPPQNKGDQRTGDVAENGKEDVDCAATITSDEGRGRTKSQQAGSPGSSRGRDPRGRTPKVGSLHTLQATSASHRNTRRKGRPRSETHAAALEEDAERGEDDGEDDLADVRGLWRIAHGRVSVLAGPSVRGCGIAEGDTGWTEVGGVRELTVNGIVACVCACA